MQKSQNARYPLLYTKSRIGGNCNTQCESHIVLFRVLIAVIFRRRRYAPTLSMHTSPVPDSSITNWYSRNWSCKLDKPYTTRYASFALFSRETHRLPVSLGYRPF